MNETETAVRKFQKELKSGTVALVLLCVMDRSSDPMYGYQITKQLESGLSSDGQWISQGALYPVLRSMEKSGLLESSVEPSTSGPPRRYYVITGTGRETLEAWRNTWEETRDFVDSILKGSGDVEYNN